LDDLTSVCRIDIFKDAANGSIEQDDGLGLVASRRVDAVPP
jgi:hypothetical protein